MKKSVWANEGLRGNAWRQAKQSEVFGFLTGRNAIDAGAHGQQISAFGGCPNRGAIVLMPFATTAPQAG